MKANDLAILMAEIRNGGPSPVIADQPEPMAIIFGDEMEMTAGKVVTSVFGEEALATIVVTSYRRMLLLRRKGGRDLCCSYWHKIDFGSWRWKEPDGFLVAGVESTFPTASEQATKMGPTATWQTFLVSPEGEQRLLEEVTVYLNQYHYHQQDRYAAWDEMITMPSGKQYIAASLLVHGKLSLGEETPGIVDLEALWRLHTDPLEAAQQSGGYIPEESPFHPSKATRATEKVAVSKVSKGTSFARKAKKALKTAISTGSQVKGAVETAQKVAGLVSSVGADAAGPGAAVAPGDGGSGIMPGVTPCIKCGALLGSGALFCGKCGHRLGEAIVEEVKDQIKGKVEDAAVEKIEQVLDTEERVEKKATSAKKSTPSSKKKTTPKKTSEPKISKAVTKCPNCEEPVTAGWKFCPECSQPLPLTCPQCGKEVQPDWKFCPQCTNALANPQTGESI